MTDAPPPPPGWNAKDVVPQSQEEAQSTVLNYLRRTLQALPPGAVIDSAGYAGNGKNMWCDDEPDDPTNVPTRFQTIGDLTIPAGMDTNGLIRRVGETWRGWGWFVFERDGFAKPNRFAYGPDGYRLQIQAANPPTYPPTIQAASPCFSAEVAHNDGQFPSEIRQS